MKLSIITINKNNAIGLEKTIQSVVNQTFNDFEYLVIDGDSEDSSVAVIKKYADKITWWVSEPDSGVYNAMNKGIKKAQGDYCLFLNSGDSLIENDTLRNAFNEIDGKADIYYSNCICSDNTITVFPEKLDINYLIKGTINHQNVIIRRKLFIEHGFYNESYIIKSDWEFFLRESWLYKIQYVHINTNIAIYDVNGMSSKRSQISILEKKDIYKNVFGELGDTLIELYNYRRSVCSDIINRWGLSNLKLFELTLRIYNRIRKTLDILFKKKYDASDKD
jgi:glycosyltransferase involved in cell wall biosynthesis